MSASMLSSGPRPRGRSRPQRAVGAVLGFASRIRYERALVVVALIGGMTLVLVETPIAAIGHDVPILAALVLSLLHAGSLPLAVVRPHLAAPLSVAAALGLQAASWPSTGAWPWWPVLIVTQTLVLLVVALRVRWPAALAYWVLAIAASGILAGIVSPGSDAASLDLVVFGGVSGAAVVLAVVLAEWGSIRAQLVRERRISASEAARRLVVEERARIARELHDVIAHSMSIISVQSSTARFRHPDFGPAALAEFEEIGAKSRQALEEMRGLLTVLRGGEDGAPRAPQPDVADMAGLVASAERAGMRVRLTPLSPADAAAVSPVTGLVAFRIVQEAISNAIRHAPGASVAITARRRGGTLLLEVVNTRAAEPAEPAEPAPSSGHGLIGMRERAASVGGSVTAAPTAAGGFRIRAELPLNPVSP